MRLKIIERYIAKTVLGSIGLVTLLLAGLQLFILLVNQIEDLGRAGFGITNAALFVLLQLPYQVYLFFPVACLLGALIGLGILANHYELVVMRAAGVSIMQIGGAILKASSILILIITLIGETLVPKTSQYAADYKTAALSKGQALRTAQGVWLRYNNDFIFVEWVFPNNVLKGVYQFRFDEKHRLQLAREIQEVHYAKDGWHAYNVKQTQFTPERLFPSHFASLPWDVSIKPQILKISGTDPEEMTLGELRRYLQEQKRLKQSVQSYELAFWQRIIQPFTTLVMMTLAIPFIFGSLRSSTMGSKLLIGAVVGFSFHLLNRFFGPMSTVFQWSAIAAAWAPTVLFAILSLYLMRRVK